MALAENPLNRSSRELPHVAHETLAWTGRHWKSVSLTAAAILGGGYLLLAPDSNPPNPSLRPTTPISDKFIPLGAGLGTDPALETITNTVTSVSRTGCIQIEGTNELAEIIYNSVTRSQQIPCRGEDAEPKKQPTFVPVGGPESQISDETLRIKYKIDAGLRLTPEEEQAVLDFNKTYQPTNNETKIIEPHTLEETLTKVEDLNQKIETISKLRSEWINSVPWTNKNEDPIPSPALREVVDQIQKYNIQLQQIYKPDGKYSIDEITLINNIYLKLNTAPAKDQKVEETKIIIDPEAKNSQFITEQVNDLLKLFPNHEKIISVIYIDSRDITWKKKWSSWIADAGCSTYKDHGAEIYIPDRPNDAENWLDKKILLQRIVHEIAHTASLYGEGYALQFLSPTEVINLAFENTLAEDKKYRKGYWGGYQEEVNAYLVADLLGNTHTLSNLRDEEIDQAYINFVNNWFSTLLGADIDIVNIGEQLNIR